MNGAEYKRWFRQAGLPELRQILFWKWDPIGVDDAFPFTADEYDQYARMLLSRLRSGTTAEETAEYVSHVERSSIELETNDNASGWSFQPWALVEPS